MILQLRDADDYRSFLDTRTADVVIQADDIDFYGNLCYWEVIIRGSLKVDAKHVDCKKQVVCALRGYTETECNNLFKRRGEATLDGILYDYANAHIREPEQETR